MPIAVGVSVGVVALIAALAFLLFWRRRTTRAQTQGRPRSNAGPGEMSFVVTAPFTLGQPEVDGPTHGSVRPFFNTDSKSGGEKGGNRSSTALDSHLGLPSVAYASSLAPTSDAASQTAGSSSSPRAQPLVFENMHPGPSVADVAARIYEPGREVDIGPVVFPPDYLQATQPLPPS